MSNTYSFDYEIMQLSDTGGIPCVLSNVTTYLGDYKALLQDAANATLRSETLRETVCDAIIANGAV